MGIPSISLPTTEIVGGVANARRATSNKSSAVTASIFAHISCRTKSKVAFKSQTRKKNKIYPNQNQTKLNKDKTKQKISRRVVLLVNTKLKRRTSKGLVTSRNYHQQTRFRTGHGQETMTRCDGGQLVKEYMEVLGAGRCADLCIHKEIDPSQRASRRRSDTAVRCYTRPWSVRQEVNKHHNIERMGANDELAILHSFVLDERTRHRRRIANTSRASFYNVKARGEDAPALCRWFPQTSFSSLVAPQGLTCPHFWNILLQSQGTPTLRNQKITLHVGCYQSRVSQKQDSRTHH